VRKVIGNNSTFRRARGHSPLNYQIKVPPLVVAQNRTKFTSVSILVTILISVRSPLKSNKQAADSAAFDSYICTSLGHASGPNEFLVCSEIAWRAFCASPVLQSIAIYADAH
jgi:hypothetical protein